MTNIDELERLLKIPCSPTTDGKEFIRVVCSVDFEPHGRASEMWEITWKLTLPQIPLHWKSTTGWRPGTTDKSMFFSGRTFNDVVQQAISFLKENVMENYKQIKELNQLIGKTITRTESAQTTYGDFNMIIFFDKEYAVFETKRRDDDYFVEISDCNLSLTEEVRLGIKEAV